jgi:hypothetical protein
MMTKKVSHRASGLHDVRRQPIHLDITRIAQDQPLLRVEHQHALRHVVQGRRELRVFLAQAPIGKRAGQTHAQYSDRGIGDRQRQRRRRERERIDDAHGIGQDLHRAHRGEVVRDDRERQQQRSDERRSYLVAANCARECRRPEHHAQSNRDRDERQIPSDASGHLECPHAGIVHGADAGTDHDAADQRSPNSRYCERDRKADACHSRRGH